MKKLLLSLSLTLASCIPICPPEALNNYSSLYDYVKSKGYQKKEEIPFKIFEQSSEEITIEKEGTKITGFYDLKGEGYCLRKNSERTTYCTKTGTNLDAYIIRKKNGEIDNFLKIDNFDKFTGKEGESEQNYFNTIKEEFIKVDNNHLIFLEIKKRITN